jgi:hypothetical protein
MAIEDHLVAIIGTSGDPVGAGLLIDDDLVLTCAHVVNVADGRGKYEKDRPNSIVKVRVHGATNVANATIDPAEDSWRPPPASSGGGDLCILRLPVGTARGKGPVTLREYSHPETKKFRAIGYPDDWKTADIARGTILGRDEDGLYILRSETDSPPNRRIFSRDERQAGVIYTGFSGAPVESGGVIVGLLTMARAPADVTAYMIPVSLFPERFAGQTERYPNRVFEAHRHVEKLCADARRRLAGEVAPFDIRLRYCKDFEEVLNVHRTSAPPASGKYDDTRDLTALLFARALHQKNGTFLLHAPGGGGKSSFLLDLILTAPDENLLPFLLDFSSSRKAAGDSGDALPNDQLRRWFGQYDRVFGDADTLLELARAESDDNVELLLVIDGVNQAHVKVTDVLATVAALSNQSLARVRIIVSDRMVDRGEVTGGFTHVVIPPLAPAAYEEALAGRPQTAVMGDAAWRPILSSPMFLDLLLTLPSAKTPSAAIVPSRFQILNSYYRDKCKFDSAELRQLADFAFETYEVNRQTAIPSGMLANLGEQLNVAIAKTDLIHELGEGHVEFRHQLLHDALAALKVASASKADEETLLRGPAFDVVSLDAASPDAIELAVEAVQRPEDLLSKRQNPLEPRELLSEVFDWNFRITLQCVASFDRRGDSPLPRWVRHAIYAHNLERLFDPYLHTVVGAERMKSLIPISSDVKPYLDAGSRDEIVKRVGGIIQGLAEDKPAEEAYRRQWIDVYSRTEPFTVPDLWPLWRDPFLAWMAANAVRRFENPPEVTAALIDMYQSSRHTSERPKVAPKAAAYRWRLVHTLGRGTAAALSTLREATLDSDESADVRYGAVRSLVELAVTGVSNDDRRRTLDELRAGLPRLFEGDGAPRIRRELRRACAFNEKEGCVSGREGWLRDWLAEGLPQFATLLRDGEKLAKDTTEAQSWRAWATAADQASGMKEWTLRETAWRQVIEKEL